MSLAKAVKELEKKQELEKSEVKCAYVKLLESMPKEDQETLLNLINVRKLATRVVVDLFVREGYRIGAPSINSHKNGSCRCTK